MMELIGNTPDYRKRVIIMILATDWLNRYGTIIVPDYFEFKVERDIVEWINNYYESYHSIPDPVYLRDYWVNSDSQDHVDYISSVISELDVGIEYVADTALRFAKQQAMKVAILQSVDAIKNDDLEQPLTLVRDALKIGQDRLELGRELIADIHDWVYDEMHGKRFPAGWPGLDMRLGGGLVCGEYGLIMAPPGRGKTTALINIGFATAGLLCGANVLHITYEMPAQKVLKRYALRLSGMKLDYHGSEKSYINQLCEKAKHLLRGRLRVIQPTDYSVGAIRRLLDGLSSLEDFETELLIVDYPDLMLPPRKRRELRFELADVSREIRQLGADYGFPVWGATQAGRHALYKEYIHVSDIAEAIEKAAIADVVIAVCQTREEESVRQGRLYASKIRDAEDKFVIPVKIDFSNQLIVQIDPTNAIIR